MDPKSLLSSLGFDKQADSGMIQQMENMWKMLDDMAENDPEQYKSFVSSNVKRGAEEIKKEKEKELEQFSVNTADGTYLMTLALTVFLKEIKPPEDMDAPKKKVGIIEMDSDSILPKSGTCWMNIIAFKHLNQTENPSLDHFEVSIDNKAGVMMSVTVAISEKSAFMIKNRCAEWKEALARCMSITQNAINQKMALIRKKYIDKALKASSFRPTEFELAALQM